jgi:hypothetical protein
MAGDLLGAAAGEEHRPEVHSTLPCYDEPDEAWDALQEGLNFAARPGSTIEGSSADRRGGRDTPAASTAPGAGITSVRWSPSSEQSFLPALLCGLDRDGVVMVRDAASPATVAALREQIEPYLAANLLASGMNKQSAGDSGRRAGAVLSRAEASWGLAMHPAVMQVSHAWAVSGHSDVA